jgi:hypothetical protein
MPAEPTAEWLLAATVMYGLYEGRGWSADQVNEREYP